MSYYKKLLTLIITITPLFLFSGVAFAAMEWPVIAGVTLTEKTWASYLFVAGVSIGVLIGTLVIVTQGITILFSAGNAGKINEARKKIFGALFGVAILGGAFAIINYLNSSMLNSGKVAEPPKAIITEPTGIYLKAGEEEFQLSNSLTSLATYNFDNKANIVEIKQSNSDSKYAAIFFSDSDYRGRCAFFGKDGSQGGSLPFKVRSVYVFKTKEVGADPAVVSVYTDDNCGVGIEETKGPFYPVQKEFNAYKDFEKMTDKSGHWIDASSLKIKSNNVLVLIQTRDKENCAEGDEECPHCQLITKTSQNETCYRLKDSYVYNNNSIDTIMPGWIKLFSKSN